MTTTEHNHIVNRRDKIIAVALKCMFLLKSDNLNLEIESKIRDAQFPRMLSIGRLVNILNEKEGFDATHDEVFTIMGSAQQNGFFFSRLDYPNKGVFTVFFGEEYSEMLKKTNNYSQIIKSKTP